MNQKTENTKPTVIEVLAGVAKRTMSEDNPERIFLEWMASNGGNLRAACEKLGVKVDDGPDFYKRLKAAVLPKLIKNIDPCPF